MNSSPQSQLTDLTIIKVKDVVNELKISQSSAKKYMQDIKLHFNIQKVCYKHLKDYLKV